MKEKANHIAETQRKNAEREAARIAAAESKREAVERRMQKRSEV